jgi:tetratricopeptide (TPR) repeat protein
MSFGCRFLLLASLVLSLAAQPFMPQGDGHVLEAVKASGTAAIRKELRSLERLVAAEPRNASAALRLAKVHIGLARDEADPRHFGRAEAVVAPWLAATNPPTEAWVLRSAVRQGSHDFDGAMADLDAALAAEPTHVGAWLARLTIQCVRSDFEGARRSAARLLRSGDELVATAAAAQVASLTGNSAGAARMLETAVGRNPSATPGMRSWCLALLADIRTRRGEPVPAELAFRDALDLTPRDPQLLGAYADFLLDHGRGAEVGPLLEGFPQVDALQLRVAEAETDPTGRARIVERLRSGIELNRARGDRVHLREEARFHLRLLGDASGALALAQENWKVQREPADARILFESAQASGDAEAARRILETLRAQGLEDVALGLTPRSR